MPLSDLRFDQADAFGAKATNVAELGRAIDPMYVPDGFAVPFSFYHTFMLANGLYDLIRTEMADPDFADETKRPKMLKSIRRAIKDAPMPTPLADHEDLVGFTGAGLYDSYTHRLDEGHISKSIKQVWASLWNARAFEERNFYRIDHLGAAMGVLLIKDLNIRNAESYETIYVRRSTLVARQTAVIARADLMLLISHLKTVHDHFKTLYQRDTDPTFALDIAFKFDVNGALAIKQSRPWTG